MENFNLTQSFFNRLYSYEKKVFKRFLILHEEKEDNKSLKLFHLLEKENKNQDVDYFIISLYDKKNEKTVGAFRKLVERFRDKMYESHFLEINLSKKEGVSPFLSAMLEVKKMVGISYNIIARGIPMSEVSRLLNKGISVAKKYEFFDEMLIFLKIKLEMQGYSEGFRKQKKILEEIEIAEINKDALFESKKLIYFYVNDLQYKSTDELDIHDEIKKASNRVRELYEARKLSNLLYDWYILEMQYCHYTIKFDKAELLQKEMLQFILTTPALYQYRKIADGYTNLSYAQAYLYKFNDAIESISKAIEYSSSNINIKNFYKEAKVFLHIYNKEINESVLLIEDILSSGTPGNTAIQYSIRKYLLATTKFLSGDYKTSFKLLQETKEIENDKEGWNIGIRMLQIYLTLETEKVDLADQRIESLRKHIERTTKMKSVRKRDVVVFRLLNHLARSGFDFNEIWEDRQKDFALLKSDDPDYRWIPRSHELILFEQWFESKVKGIGYQPVFPTPVNE